MLDSAETQGIPSGVFDPYVPRAVLNRLAAGSPPGPWAATGTMVFCDLSGFTRLSERLQRTGREGAELLAGAINDCFSDMLGVAHRYGGSLVKFGGDALLLFFDGADHAAEACRAAHGMRSALRARQPVRAGDARVVLRMTVGVHSDTYHFFLAGRSHLECLLVGAAVTAVARTEEAAASGQIVVSTATAAALPEACLGRECGPSADDEESGRGGRGGGASPSADDEESGRGGRGGGASPSADDEESGRGGRGGGASPSADDEESGRGGRGGGASPRPGRLLRRAPDATEATVAGPAWAAPRQDELVARGLSTAVRAYLTGGRQPPEHRLVTVAFLKFKGTDALLADLGPDGAAAALGELVAHVSAAADEHEVCFLGSDVDADGGKIILCAGAPRATGDDEERMLLTLRRIMDAPGRIPLCAGVNRGPAFAGEIGTPFRRVYTVMGDTVNLSARLMARAEPGRIYATAGVLEHSPTRFTTTACEPFVAKGKALPVLAWDVGPARPRAPAAAGKGAHLPLFGRQAELGVIVGAVEAAARHQGCGLVEIAGPGGIGKSRLLAEAREQAGALGVSQVRVVCEAYTATVPYAAWHQLARPLLGLAGDEPDAAVADRLAALAAERDPDLIAFLPLLAEVFGVEVPATAQVDALAGQYRRAATHDAVLRFLGPALEHPTLVEVDEANALDEASAALFATLAGSPSPSAWMLLVAGRPVPGGAFVTPTGDRVTRLALAPLAAADATALAEAATESAPLPPHVAALAVERSGGHPQFLLDVMRIAASGSGGGLPESAAAAATARLDTLLPAERSLVRRVSVLGAEFQRRHVPAILDPAASAVDERTWERLREIFEDRDGGRVRFRSGVMRDAAYASLPFGLRRELHAAAGAALLADDADGPAAHPDPAVLSLHLLLAGYPAAALPLAVAAAEAADSHAAPADAARLYRRALEAARAAGAEAGTRAEITEALGVSLRRAGETSGADEAWATARRLMPDDRLRHARLFDRHSGLANRSGRLGSSLRWARRGLRALDGREGDEAARWRARLNVHVASVRYAQGRYPDAVRLCRAVIAEAERAGEELALAKGSYLLDVSLVGAGMDADADHSGRALAIYRRLGRDEEAAVVVNNLGAVAYWDGHWDEALRRYREGAELCGRVGDVCGAAYGDCNIGEVLSDQGHYEEAQAALGRALRTWRATDDREGTAIAGMFLGRLAGRRGDGDAATALLRSSVETLASLGLSADAVLAEAFLAEAIAFTGPRGAEAALEMVDRLQASPGSPEPLLLRVRALALAGAGAGAGVVAAALESALAAARAGEAGYDVAVTLDALCRLGFRHGPDGDRSTERDALLDRFGVERLPEPPLGRSTPVPVDSGATRPGAPGDPGRWPGSTG